MPRATDSELELGKAFTPRRMMRGLLLTSGSSALASTLSDGTFIDQAGRRVDVTGADDAFASAAPASGFAKRALYFVGYRSYLDTGLEDTAGPVFFTVDGPEAAWVPAGGTDLEDPDDGEVLLAALTANANLTNLSYVYPVGSRIIAKDGDGATVRYEPVTLERVGEVPLLTVSDGLTARDVGAPYAGWRGLEQLLGDLALLEAGLLTDTLALGFEVRARPLEVRLAGFFVADRRLDVPANVVVAGPAAILPLVTTPLRVSGRAYQNVGGDTWAASPAGDQANVPAGSKRILVEIDPAYQATPSLVELGLDRPTGNGCIVEFTTATPGDALVPAARAIPTAAHAFTVIMTDDELAVFNPTSTPTGNVVLRKVRSGLRDLHYIAGGSMFGEPEVEAAHTENLVLERVGGAKMLVQDAQGAHVQCIRARGWDSDFTRLGAYPTRSSYRDIQVEECGAAPVARFGVNEWDASYSGITFRSAAYPLELLGERASADSLKARLDGQTVPVAVTESLDVSGTGTLGGGLPVVRKSAVVFYTKADPETFETGDGGAGPYAGSLTAEVLPGSVRVYAADGSGGGTGDIVDDGAGNLVQDGVSRGTVDYASGAISVTFADVVTNGEDVTADRTLAVWLLDDGAGGLLHGVGGANEGTIDYDTGDYAVTLPWVPDEIEMSYAYGGAVVLNSTDSSFARCDGVLVLGELSSGNFIDRADNAIFRVGLEEGASGNTIARLRVQLVNPGDQVLSSEVQGTRRMRAGSSVFAGTDGVVVAISPAMPDATYKVGIVPTGDLSTGALGEVWVSGKVRNRFTVHNSGWAEGVTGTGTVTSVGTAVTGSGTAFSTELEVGQRITVDGQARVIDTIPSDTSLTVTVAFSPNVVGEAFTYTQYWPGELAFDWTVVMLPGAEL